jgi:hypothetical protein
MGWVGRLWSENGGPGREWERWAGGRAGLVGFAESPPAGSQRRDLFAESLTLGEANFNQKIIEIANKSENFPTLNMTLYMVCIAYKKVVVVKLKFKFL